MAQFGELRLSRTFGRNAMAGKKNRTGAQDATGDHRNPRTKRFGGHPQTTLAAGGNQLKLPGDVKKYPEISRFIC